MPGYAYNPRPEKSARVYGRGARVSQKSSILVCRKVTGMRSDKAKRLLENMLIQKESLDGKFYTNVSGEILKLINSAEKNAESKGLDTERLFVHASAHRGFTMYTPRGLKRRREQRKVTNLQVVLEQR